MTDELDWDSMSEEEQRKEQRRENRQLRRHSRNIRLALLDKVTKDKDSEEFTNLDGSTKQVYAVSTLLDGLDRDVNESEKVLASQENDNANNSLVTSVFEAMVNKLGNPAAVAASGARGTRTVGTNARLRPDNEASKEHMHRGRDDINFEDVFESNEKEE